MAYSTGTLRAKTAALIDIQVSKYFYDQVDVASAKEKITILCNTYAVGIGRSDP